MFSFPRWLIAFGSQNVKHIPTVTARILCPILTHPRASFAKLPTVHTSSTSCLSPIEFERQSQHTLEYLSSAFEDLSDQFDFGSEFDVSYADGVLTVTFGPPHGTYVLNKQTPNKQIWLSSPKSGPKRYDFDPSTRSWIYLHTRGDLFELLSEEVSAIAKSSVMFRNPLMEP
ncbi:unnamed protein product [Mesocestoides corti]|uniref:ferroxidase n=1 Tax=Mesocestoides corti TaxID=53468 RepID=A0A0R3UG98_MESCO|nr:unnamed protein product [Mesocestoides corti]